MAGAAMSAIMPFPIGRIRDRAIIAALRPFVEQAIAAKPGASARAISIAANRLIDPESASPTVAREGCRAVLEQIACDILAGGAP
jgi:hypothetical protein